MFSLTIGVVIGLVLGMSAFGNLAIGLALGSGTGGVLGLTDTVAVLAVLPGLFVLFADGASPRASAPGGSAQAGSLDDQVIAIEDDRARR
ncbi:hypothetical protein WJ438_36955 [Streptomyces sp. GD-15H]|uniref:hypothetical protein n=1 Tax=Streptomyces sp. GD-15H TaxID=3129112 RepID=UPI0032533324